MLIAHTMAFRTMPLVRRTPRSSLHQSTSSADTASSSTSSSTGTPLLYQLVSGSTPWNTLVGQADRAFCLALSFEKNGQARRASTSFHEAATLYQCFLDSPGEFGHVTGLQKGDCATILSYACIRLGFLNYDALGDPLAGVRLYKESAAIDPVPSAVTYEGIGEAIEAAYAGRKLDNAIVHYDRALELQPNRPKTAFRRAVALDRSGKEEEAQDILDQLRRHESPIACLVDSWGYVRWHTRMVPKEDLNVYRGTRDMLEIALQEAQPLIEAGGLVTEFGVASGRSMRMTQEILPLDVPIHGFDTFTGLPQAWGNEPRGAYSTGGVIPNIGGNVVFHKGLFSDTIKPFLDASGDAVLAYANIDCDLYSSTLDILESFHGRIVPGTILIFDEYICHPTWRQDEFRAWRECCKRFGWKYEYLAFSLSSKQAVVRVIG